MMFKFKLKTLTVDEAQFRIKQKVNAIIKDTALLNELGTAIVDDVVFQAKRGVSAKTGDRFKPLSSGWIKERDKISKSTQPGELYSKRRSNLTLSGQLLDSFKIVAFRGASVIMSFVGVHKPYLAKYVKSFKRNGKTVTTNRQGLRTIGKQIQNKDLAEYVQNDRPFVGVRPKLMQTLKNIAIRFIRRRL